MASFNQCPRHAIPKMVRDLYPRSNVEFDFHHHAVFLFGRKDPRRSNLQNCTVHVLKRSGPRVVNAIGHGTCNVVSEAFPLAEWLLKLGQIGFECHHVCRVWKSRSRNCIINERLGLNFAAPRRVTALHFCDHAHRILVAPRISQVRGNNKQAVAPPRSTAAIRPLVANFEGHGQLLLGHSRPVVRYVNARASVSRQIFDCNG